VYNLVYLDFVNPLGLPQKRLALVGQKILARHAVQYTLSVDIPCLSQQPKPSIARALAAKPAQKLHMPAQAKTPTVKLSQNLKISLNQNQ